MGLLAFAYVFGCISRWLVFCRWLPTDMLDSVVLIFSHNFELAMQLAANTGTAHYFASLFMLYSIKTGSHALPPFHLTVFPAFHVCLSTPLSLLSCLQVPILKPMELMVEASPRRIFANAHTYHINSISINSDQETYLSADDLRINLWHLEVTDQVCGAACRHYFDTCSL